MSALIFAQTIFYFVASLAMIVLGTLAAIVIYYLIRLAKNLNDFSGDLNLALKEVKDDFTKNFNAISSNLNQSSEEIMEKIKFAMERISNLPILSLLFSSSTGGKGGSASGGKKSSGKKYLNKKGRK